MFLAASSVKEFEVNPVIVLPKGKGLVAGDALVTANDNPLPDAPPK